MSGRTGIVVLRIVLGVLVAGASLALVVRQVHGRTHIPLLALGVLELISALLFLSPRTVRLGGIALICTFALAALFHALHGEYNTSYLAVYAAAAFAVISNRSEM